MGHFYSEEAEKILDKEFKVLDYGFVTLIDYMGNEKRIAQTAKESYNKDDKIDKIEGFVRGLIKNEHTSPIENVVLQFKIKCPIFVARQWLRHRTARVNELSMRYTEAKPEFYIPSAERVPRPSDDTRYPTQYILEQGYHKAYEDYLYMLKSGTSREIARLSLPVALYTEFYWQMDLNNLLHFLKLRCDSHAQWEIQQYANTILDITKKITPNVIKVFKEINNI
jgi:thymidylate synthase (FAD)